MTTLLERPDALTSLREAVGTDALATDAETLALHGQDVFARGHDPVAVFRPRDIGELARGLKAAAQAGLTIVPRGGGMSYTSGYLPDAPGALLVDTGAMTRILAVDETDMCVTVEAGVTWAELYATLHPRGLRVPLWGTLSGCKATVGGG